ncbi:G-protein coupled receptor Mth2-like [Stomoxys calcitrans]|uniref:G-protein coupled receptor Mth2-like n=1 Tax=Stomoxys calcitrans TaxID=35570 RepID=UPI0027E2DB02|nr:G-protein coupled receptor Mth2-like [Stomoxys calcitrans]
MAKLLLKLLLVVAMLYVFRVQATQLASEIATCDFEDTVDLTNARKFANGSYHYKGLSVPSEQVAIYDYIVTAEGEKQAHEPHPRACVCHERNCIQFCCDPIKEVLSRSGKCVPLRKRIDYDSRIRVISRKDSDQLLNALEDFIVVKGIPCANAYALSPKTTEQDDWEMLENGTMMLTYYDTILSRNNYCLTPQLTADNTWSLTAFNCPIPNGLSTTLQTFNYGAAMSTVLLFIVVIIYLCKRQLRNIYGHCIVYCLLSLILGNCILFIISFTEVVFPKLLCSCMGFSAYFFFESSFIWLAILAYDIWLSLRTSENANVSDKKRLQKYEVIGICIPLCVTMVAVIIQYSNIDNGFKPGVGEEYCWIDVHKWASLIYLFGLNSLILLCSYIIHCLSLRDSTNKKQHQQVALTPDLDVNMLHIYLMFLSVISISWFLYFASFLEEMTNSTTQSMRYATGIMNFIDGPAILFILVIKTRVTSLRRKRSPSTESLCGLQYSKVTDDDVSFVFGKFGKQKTKKSNSPSP